MEKTHKKANAAVRGVFLIANYELHCTKVWSRFTLPIQSFAISFQWEGTTRDE